MIIIFVVFIDQLIDYPINCASLRKVFFLFSITDGGHLWAYPEMQLQPQSKFQASNSVRIVWDS